MKAMKNKRIAGAAAGCCLLLLSACGSTNRIAHYEPRMPERYPWTADRDAADTTTLADMPWETFFPDTILQGHIRRALANNHSFRNALETVIQARNEISRQKGAMFPSAGLEFGTGVERFGDYTMDGVGNSTTNTPDLPPSKHIPSPYSDFRLGIGFSWEADIWGKLNQRRKAAVERFLASEQAVLAARSLLITEIASQYYDLVGLDHLRTVLEESIAETEASCELTYELKQAGEETQLAVDQFDARLLKLKGRLLENESAIRAKERALAILTANLKQPVGRVSFTELTRTEFPVVQTGVPSQLLSRRPDIRAAEHRLEAAGFDVGAARRSFYPSLEIGGAFGFNAFDAGLLFLSPASLVYRLGAGLTAPLFRQNQLKAQYADAESRHRMALNTYRETILVAYQELVGVMTDLHLTESRIRLNEQEVASYRNATFCAEEMFELQFAGYLEVLSAEEAYLDSRLKQISLYTDFCKLHVDLFRALGGGVR